MMQAIDTLLVNPENSAHSDLKGGTPLPAWLLPDSNNLRWHFRRDVPGYAPSHYTVSWEVFSGNQELNNQRFKYWRDTCQRAVIAYAGSIYSKNLRSTSIISFARALRTFTAWACLDRCISSLSHVNADDINAYEVYIESLRIGQSHASTLLFPIKALWDLRHSIGETIGHRCYPQRGSIKSVAKRIGKRTGRTRTLKPETYFQLLDHCLKIIDESEEWIQAALHYSEIKKSNPRSCRRYSYNGLSVKKIIEVSRQIYGASVILIFSLLGSRKHEIAHFKVSDAKNLIIGQDSTLVGTVTKSSNGTGGDQTSRTVIPELKRALEIIIRLTGADLNEDTTPLFRPMLLDKSLTKRKDEALDTGQIYKMISRVEKVAGIELKIRPHMFRRAFSMIYIWRYEIGDLEYLSRILQHRNLRHTLAYTQGDDVSEYISDSERDLARSIMERAITGKERFGGGFGARLERYARRLRASITVLRPEQVDDWIDSRIGNGGISIAPGPHGYCVLIGDRGSKGLCSTDGKIPNLINRTDEHCSSCPNFLLTNRSADYWHRRFDIHQKIFQTSRIAVVKEAARIAAGAARRMLKSLGVIVDE